MSNISQFLTAPWAQPTCGVAPIAQAALVELGADGRAYPAQVSDFAAFGTQGAVFSGPAQIDSDGITIAPCGGSGRAVIVSPVTGDIYVLSTEVTNQHLQVSRYTSAGILLKKVLALSVVVAETGNITFLSNGNILVSGGSSSGGIQVAYIIYTPALVPVFGSAQFNNMSTANSTGVATVALPGGGFMGLYSIGASNTLQLSLYDNAGTFVSSTTMTSTTPTNQYSFGLSILSDGNVLASYATAGAISVAKYNASGVLQTGPVATGIGYTDPFAAVVSVINGFFAVAVTDNANHILCRVLDNSLTPQGALITTTAYTSVASKGTINIVTDGADFWLFSGLLTHVTTGGVTTDFVLDVPFDTAHSTGFACAYDGCGNIVVIAVDTTGNTGQYAVFSTVQGRQTVPPTTVIFNPLVPANLGTTMPPWPVGDSMLFFTTGQFTNAVNEIKFTMVKVAATAILGPANQAATQGQTLPVNNLSTGVLSVNRIAGTVDVPYASLLNGGGRLIGTQLLQLGVGANPNL